MAFLLAFLKGSEAQDCERVAKTIVDRVGLLLCGDEVQAAKPGDDVWVDIGLGRNGLDLGHVGPASLGPASS